MNRPTRPVAANNKSKSPRETTSLKMGTTVGKRQKAVGRRAKSKVAIPIPPQIVLDKMPNLMNMTVGDIYYLPTSIPTIQIAVEWGNTTSGASDVDIVLLMFDGTGKRYDYVTSGRKMTKDKSISYGTENITNPIQSSQSPQECLQFPKKETFSVKLDSIPTEVMFLEIIITMKSAGKTLSDLKRPSVCIYDTSYYPDNPELMRFDFSQSDSFVPSVALLSIESEGADQSLSPSAPLQIIPESPAPTNTATVSTSRQITQQRPKKDLCDKRLWTVRALGEPLLGRNFKQVGDEAENLVMKLITNIKNAVTAVECNFGGDQLRVAAERLIRRAQQLTENPDQEQMLTDPKLKNQSETSPLCSPHKSIQQTSNIINSLEGQAIDEEDCASDISSLITETSSIIEKNEEQVIPKDLFYVYNGMSSRVPPTADDPNVRPRVFRKGKRSYTIGEGVVFKERASDDELIDADDQEVLQINKKIEIESLDEELLESVFPHYANRNITRYEPNTYNIGSHKSCLMAHYIRNKGSYDKLLTDFANSSRKPVVVGYVSKGISEPLSSTGLQYTKNDTAAVNEPPEVGIYKSLSSMTIEEPTFKPTLPAEMEAMAMCSARAAVRSMELLQESISNARSRGSSSRRKTSRKPQRAKPNQPKC